MKYEIQVYATFTHIYGTERTGEEDRKPVINSIADIGAWRNIFPRRLHC